MKMVIHILVVLFGLLQGFSSADATELSSQNATSAKVLHRQKRIVYTYNSATGILAALSVPLIIPNRNIFFAYNFEMNYNMPTSSTDYTQGVLKRVESPDLNTKRDTGRRINESKPSANFTRKKIYRTIEVNLNRLGLNGKRCLFRAICETADNPLYEHNGILGDLIHILLTPSHSKDEKLPAEFYRAEKLGANHDCGKYHKHCPKSLLDIISVLI
ncbi:AAEL008711-PA [Aedes aegypti]|uniref:AAEL008711-PA n=2 Tax=Aedes aegypti TaxID=7159 RepID=A0A1S4FK84_AEDAE|nr:uncharacterized protein LOC5570975 [Aedes aegypti]EAT39491.1 AAEL008711-PA [Aedes aegypti]